MGREALNFSFAAAPRPARGLTPPALDDAVHVVRCLEQLRSKDKNIEKYIYLSQLKDADPSMFYKICVNHMSVRAYCRMPRHWKC